MTKRVVVLATSPKKRKLLVLGEKNFHILNTEDDWPIGKKRKAPIAWARALLHDCLLGIPCKKYLRSCEFDRVVLPSGSHCYITSDVLISESVYATKRARRHLGLCDSVHFHDIEKIRTSKAFESYTSLTIEAVQSIFGNSSPI